MLKKWTPTLLLGITALLEVISPELQKSMADLVTRHPVIGTEAALVAAWILHALPSPVGGGQK